MYGDFSRDSFDRTKHFRRVLIQQGRVLLDSDFNEQAAILLHYTEELTKALIGPFAAVADGFDVTTVDLIKRPPKVTLANGCYFVDGLLCECDGGAFDIKGDLSALDPAKKDRKHYGLLYLT